MNKNIAIESMKFMLDLNVFDMFLMTQDADQNSPLFFGIEIQSHIC